jgi:hypothetical protein
MTHNQFIYNNEMTLIINFQYINICLFLNIVQTNWIRIWYHVFPMLIYIQGTMKKLYLVSFPLSSIIYKEPWRNRILFHFPYVQLYTGNHEETVSCIISPTLNYIQGTMKKLDLVSFHLMLNLYTGNHEQTGFWEFKTT